MENTLIVPENFAVRNEFWQGFGNKEAFITGVSAVILSALAFALYCFAVVSTITAMMGVIGSCAVVITLIQKLDNGLSIVDHMTILLRYKRTQQEYLYTYREGKRFG